MENPAEGEGSQLKSNPVKKFLQLITYPSYSRTLGLVAVLLIITIIPLTVYLSQQRQEIRQHAATQQTCSISGASSSISPGGSFNLHASYGTSWSDSDKMHNEVDWYEKDPATGNLRYVKPGNESTCAPTGDALGTFSSQCVSIRGNEGTPSNQSVTWTSNGNSGQTIIEAHMFKWYSGGSCDSCQQQADDSHAYCDTTTITVANPPTNTPIPTPTRNPTPTPTRVPTPTRTPTVTSTPPPGNTTLTESPLSVPVGGTITGTWANIPNPTARDWGGVFIPGTPDDIADRLDFIYLNSCTQTPGTTAETTSGSCLRTLPITIGPGTYELRIYTNDTFTRLATSNTFTVTSLTPSPSITPTPMTTITTTPTATLTPSPTPPSGTRLALTLYLQGVGSASNGDNPNPLSATRQVTVQVFDNNNSQVGGDVTGTVTFNSSTGLFMGTIDGSTALSSLTTGDYTVKVKSDRYLRKLVPGIQKITAGGVNTLPQTNLIVGDINGDNVLDIIDYNLFLGCYNVSPVSSSCTNSDLNDNGFVDGIDYNFFVRSLSQQQGD